MWDDLMCGRPYRPIGTFAYACPEPETTWIPHPLSDAPASVSVEVKIRQRVKTAVKATIIAEVCYETLSAFDAATSGLSRVSWKEQTLGNREANVEAIIAHLMNPNITPEESHADWVQEMQAGGWSYGDVLNAEKKLHPNLRPYADLPELQKIRYTLMINVVRALVVMS